MRRLNLPQMVRSYLIAPGDDEQRLADAFAAGADAVVLDLENVPFDAKRRARDLVLGVLRDLRAMVRVNVPWSDLADLDLAIVGHHAEAIIVPRIESAADIEWIANRLPEMPIVATVQTPLGILNAPEIAAHHAIAQVIFDGSAICREIGVEPSQNATMVGRSRVVYASAAAKIGPPIDGPAAASGEVRAEAEHARSMGLFGKLVSGAGDVAAANAAFMPTKDDIRWARQLIDAYDKAGGVSVGVPGGSTADLPAAERARAILAIVDRTD